MGALTRSKSIRRRLLGDQVLLILILGAALMATTFFGARRAVETLSRRIIVGAIGQVETELGRFFDPVASALEALRSWGEAGVLPEDDPDALRELILPVTGRLPQVSGVLLADDRGGELSLIRIDDVWSDRLTPASDSSGISPPTYDPRTRPWFQDALANSDSGAVFWTDPYLFSTQQVQGMTASVTYFGPDERRRVAAFDVTLSELSRHARGIEVSPGGSLWVLTEDRRLLAWPDDPDLWEGRDPSTALLERPRDLGLRLVDDAAEALGERSIDELAVPARFLSGGKDWWAAGRRFKISNERALLIVVAVPHTDLLGDRARLRWWILAVTVAVLAAAVVRASASARSFSRPIESLARQSDRISQGDLEPGRRAASGLTEVERLADAHDHMRRGLKTLLKLEGDLQLARQIQQNTFPRQLPTLAGFDITAWNQPADETGGDSYDVIGLADGGSIVEGEADSVVLMLADATGHGIGPALSVTQLRAMLRMAVRAGSALGEMAAHMNEQLYADLPRNRFITAWLGLLRADGIFSTYSAGQAPILLYRAESDEVEVRNADATPFGLLPPMSVNLPAPTELQSGDIYAVLSDGFFEASDAAGEEFGTERLAELIRRHRSAGAEEILEALRKEVREFTGDAPLDDDRTAVIIKRLRPRSH